MLLHSDCLAIRSLLRCPFQSLHYLIPTCYSTCLMRGNNPVSGARIACCTTCLQTASYSKSLSQLRVKTEELESRSIWSHPEVYLKWFRAILRKIARHQWLPHRWTNRTHRRLTRQFSRWRGDNSSMATVHNLGNYCIALNKLGFRKMGFICTH